MNNENEKFYTMEEIKEAAKVTSGLIFNDLKEIMEVKNGEFDQVFLMTVLMVSKEFEKHLIQTLEKQLKESD